MTPIIAIGQDWIEVSTKGFRDSWLRIGDPLEVMETPAGRTRTGELVPVDFVAAPIKGRTRIMLDCTPTASVPAMVTRDYVGKKIPSPIHTESVDVYVRHIKEMAVNRELSLIVLFLRKRRLPETARLVEQCMHRVRPRRG